LCNLNGGSALGGGRRGGRPGDSLIRGFKSLFGQKSSLVAMEQGIACSALGLLRESASDAPKQPK